LAIDEVCEHGQYVFKQNEDRRRGYTSAHLRRVRQKRNRENKITDNTATETK